MAYMLGPTAAAMSPKTPSSTAVTLLSDTAWSQNSRVVKNLKRIEKAWFPVS